MKRCICENCGKYVFKYPSNIGKRSFCDKKCYKEYQQNNGCNHSKEFNIRYFEKIDSEDKAYFLGIIYGDGHVLKSGEGMEITTHIDDIEILKKFLKVIKSKNVKIDNHPNQKKCRIRIFSKILVKDLNLQGVMCGKKSKLIIEPKIDKNLLRHFYRGLLDSDGSVYLSNTKKSFVLELSGNKKMCEGIRNFLNFDNNKHIYKKEKKGYSPVYCFRKNLTYYNDVKKIYNIFYIDSFYFLKRKEKRWRSYLNDRKQIEELK